MNCWCIMVKTGEEEKFKSQAEQKLLAENPSERNRLYFFKKRMQSRRNQQFIETLFPGYVFLESEKLGRAKIELLKTVYGFYHFLLSNEKPQALSGYDLEYFSLFKKSGEVLGLSRVCFDAKQRIVIIDGPLKGLEGNVIRVNQRCKRVTIEVDMLGAPRKIDLSYTEVASV